MTPLDHLTRRKIFYGLIVLFLVVVPLVLLYSRGYVIDFRGRNLVATGGVFVKTIQPGAKVYIDNILSDKTSFISHGALLTNLFPQRYSVRVEKEGYRPWVKSVLIADEQVIEFRDVFLPKATITPSALFNTRSKSPSRLDFHPGYQYVAVQSGEPAKPFTLFFVDPETRQAPATTLQVSRFVAKRDGKESFIGRGAPGRFRWYRLTVLADGPGRETPISFRGLPANFSAEAISPHPTSSSDFYFFAGGALFLQGVASVPIPIAEQVHAYGVASDHLYFVSKNGFFFESDLNGENTNVLGRRGLFLDEGHPAEITVAPNGEIFVLDSVGGLFIYQPGHDQELEFVAGNVLGVDFGSSGDRMIYRDDNHISVYWLRDNTRQPFDIARSHSEIFHSTDVIQSAYLDATGTNVFFSTAHGIFMTEVDQRAGANTYPLVQSPVQSFVFDASALALYWVEGSTVYEASVE